MNASFLLFCFLVSAVQSCGIDATGAMSLPGGCAGPEERALTRYSNVVQLNSGCSASQVPYYADGNTNSSMKVITFLFFEQLRKRN